MNNFIISSSSSEVKFVFTNRNGEYFDFEVVGEDIRASKTVSTYTDEFGIPNLISRLCDLNSPWQGSESWKSLEGEFEIAFTCNSTGHVTTQVKLTQWNGGSEDWHTIVHLDTEIGALKKIASEARAFFNA